MSELIDREATVKQICKMGDMVGGHDRDVVISIALFVQDDKTAFPTVERPHGEWIETNSTDLKCSICGHRELKERTLVTSLNYCSLCGADMRKEGEAE